METIAKHRQRVYTKMELQEKSEVTKEFPSPVYEDSSSVQSTVMYEVHTLWKVYWPARDI